MALILEVLHPTGARTWHRLGEQPLLVGRSLTNDLVLDDPFVDGRHARITCDEAGTPLIEDLGSVNGLVGKDGRFRGRMFLGAGAEIRVGRTMLRFRDTDEPVPPALVDDFPVPAVPAEARAASIKRLRRLARVRRWSTTTGGRLTIAATAMAAVAVYTWLGSMNRASASEALYKAVVFALTITVWSGIWAVASRVSIHRFQFVGHVATASAVALGGLLWMVVADWLSFFFPDASLPELLSFAVGLFLLVALVAGHLALASALPRRRRWRAGGIVAGTALVIAALATVAEEETFSDVPTFSGVVKPISPNWVPTETVDEFGAVMVHLKDQVDEMAKQ